MSNSQTPLDSRIFAAQPLAMHAVALQLRRNPRAAANARGPLVSTGLKARPPVPGQRLHEGFIDRDLAAETANGAPGSGPGTMTK